MQCVKTPEEQTIVRETPPLLTSCVASPFNFPLGRESQWQSTSHYEGALGGCFRGGGVCVAAEVLGVVKSS